MEHGLNGMVIKVHIYTVNAFFTILRSKGRFEFAANRAGLETVLVIYLEHVGYGIHFA